jgi:uncharacterized protein
MAAMDLVQLRPAGRQLIERYGPAGFRVAGVIHRGPVLVFPDQTLAWTATCTAAVTWASLLPVVEHGAVQILLIGLGRRVEAPASTLRAELRRAGIALEAMDTGAACRTYNMLLAEDRQVAAALIPPD